MDSAGAARALTSDANHFLYLVKANQLFVAGGGADYLKKIKAPILLITQPDDLVFHADGVKQLVEGVKAAGGKIEHVTLAGSRGHLDGVLSMKQAEPKISAFLTQP